MDTDHSNSFIPITSSQGRDGGKMLRAVTFGLHPNQLAFANFTFQPRILTGF
ncbi:hypothetical protein GYMLUDRAFT_43201 [Collybiopsis luxurians FD-317 M1]|uniref:Uncharacterized protein n=1 Tax=Collybiopsis luxurians FD-317 M1 TaxID=944289 RepID=A0A0D0CEU9_9AGAR|nr:hypothetical protein GYMLUDRAFT_43201 [Collybiopsis luxurians FD-317 M1]